MYKCVYIYVYMCIYIQYIGFFRIDIILVLGIMTQ